MAIRAGATPQQIARRFAELVREEPAARKLWLEVRDHDIQLWLLATDTDRETENRLYEASFVLAEAFPDAPIHFHLLVPRFYVNGDPQAALPPGLEEIPLRAEQ